MTNTEVFIYMKNDYYVGLDLGSGSVGWLLLILIIIFSVHMEKLYGVSAYLILQKQQKNDVYFVLHVEDYNAATGD